MTKTAILHIHSNPLKAFVSPCFVTTRDALLGLLLVATAAGCGELAPRGPQGPPGPQGEAGTNASLDIQSVTYNVPFSAFTASSSGTKTWFYDKNLGISLENKVLAGYFNVNSTSGNSWLALPSTVLSNGLVYAVNFAINTSSGNVRVTWRSSDGSVPANPTDVMSFRFIAIPVSAARSLNQNGVDLTDYALVRDALQWTD